MSWNYRIVHQSQKIEDCTIHTYAIHEAYYDKDDEVEMISAEPDYPAGETLDELKTAIKHYLEALEKPILEYSDIVEEQP